MVSVSISIMLLNSYYMLDSIMLLISYCMLDSIMLLISYYMLDSNIPNIGIMQGH